MGAGKLTEKFSFQSRQEQSDDAGNTVSGWIERFQSFGNIKFFKGREKVIAAAETSIHELIITVRKSSNTVLINGAWRAVDLRNNKTYNVRIVEPHKNRQYLDVLAQSGGADG